MSRSIRWGAAALGTFVLLVVFVRVVAAPYADARFNPVDIAPPYETGSAATTVHEGLAVADMHSDMLLWSRPHDERSKRGHMDIPRLRDGNVAMQVFSVVTKSPWGQSYEANDDKSDRITMLAMAQGWPVRTWSSLKERALYQASVLREIAGTPENGVGLVRTARDLEGVLAQRSQGERTIAALLAMEGLHAIESATDSATDGVDELFEAGFRMMALTHMFDNKLAGAAHGVSRGGLTESGAQVIRRMEELGIVVDLAHASSKTITDVLDLVSKPVVVSHTGVQGVCPSSRNLSDDEVRRVAETGGVIGIGFWPGAVCGTEAEDIVESIRYVVDLVGVEHVGLGSDFDGTVTAPFDTSGLALLTEALLDTGYSEDEISLIMGGNTVRVLRAVLPM